MFVPVAVFDSYQIQKSIVDVVISKNILIKFAPALLLCFTFFVVLFLLTVKAHGISLTCFLLETNRYWPGFNLFYPFQYYLQRPYHFRTVKPW